MNSKNDLKKSKSAKRDVFGVYVIPIAVGLCICGIVYLLAVKFNLTKTDKIFGYATGAAVGLVLNFRNRSKWLPPPDGSYINIKKLNDVTEKLDLDKKTIQPQSYVAVFYQSIFSKIVAVICGLAIISFGIYTFAKSSVIFPMVITASGIFMLYSWLKEMFDKQPKLKLSRDGLWTNELGFRPWRTIRKTIIKTENSSRSSQTYLEIYLKSDNNDYPQQRLSINNIKNRDKIKQLIEDLCSK